MTSGKTAETEFRLRQSAMNQTWHTAVRIKALWFTREADEGGERVALFCVVGLQANKT